MTQEELIKSITEKCVEANPGIMELKFGCRVIYNKNPWIVVGEDATHFSMADNFSRCAMRKTEKYLTILGREPTLSDVLMTLDHLGKLIRIDTEGFFYTWEIEDAREGKRYCNSSIHWDLKQNLSGQTLECLTFIHSLLGNGKL